MLSTTKSSSFLLLVLAFIPLQVRGASGSAPQSAPPPAPIVSRAEQWRQKRLQKLQNKEVPQRSTLEKTVILVEKKGLQNLVRYKNFYPKFGSTITGSGFSLGVRYWLPDIKGSGIDFQSSAAYSILKQYQFYDLQFGKVQPRAREFFRRPNITEGPALQLGDTLQKGHRFFLYADLRYRDLPEEDFFGLGPHSEEANRSNFRQKDMSYDAVMGYQFSSWLSAAARVGYLRIYLKPGKDSSLPDIHELFDDVSAPGLARQPDFLHSSVGVLVDFRDRPGNPHRGAMVGLSLTRFDDRGGGGQFEFNRFAADTRFYLPLGSDQRVLAFRFFTLLTDEEPGSRVPFYLQETLGGDTTLRGFENFRFRDSNMIYLSAEYRWEALPSLEFAIFYDRGKVFADRADYDFTSLEKGFGFGVRAKTLESTVIRVDFARSREDDFRVHFRFSRSF